MILTHLYDLPSKCGAMTMTMRHDPGQPFLYVATKEGGLTIYRDDGSHHTLGETFPLAAFASASGTVLALCVPGNDRWS